MSSVFWPPPLPSQRRVCIEEHSQGARVKTGVDPPPLPSDTLTGPFSLQPYNAFEPAHPLQGPSRGAPPPPTGSFKGGPPYPLQGPSRGAPATPYRVLQGGPLPPPTGFFSLQLYMNLEPVHHSYP